jgi:hypothetical protein
MTDPKDTDTTETPTGELPVELLDQVAGGASTVVDGIPLALE